MVVSALEGGLYPCTGGEGGAPRHSAGGRPLESRLKEVRRKPVPKRIITGALGYSGCLWWRIIWTETFLTGESDPFWLLYTSVGCGVPTRARISAYGPLCFFFLLFHAFEGLWTWSHKWRGFPCLFGVQCVFWSNGQKGTTLKGERPNSGEGESSFLVDLVTQNNGIWCKL